MNDTVQLKQEIIAKLDLLPLEGLKLLIKIITFLQTKFKLSPPSSPKQQDLELLNRHAARLNEEALDVLTYQIPL